jgi:MFS family permease
MSNAGPLSTITIAVSSFVGVLFGGWLSDRWVQRNLRGRIYTSAIGLGMTIPALLLLGMGHSLLSVVGAGLLFGVGYGMFDANNMPILCQFISAKYRATAYGIMNMTGVFAGALVTQVLGKWTDGGNLGLGFALLGGVVALALILQLTCLRPVTDNKD